MEECDDSNVANNDGCSAVCAVETTAPECFDILESVDAVQLSTYVTPDGRVLIAGGLRSVGKQMSWIDGWAGAFDTDGKPLWSIDFGSGESGNTDLFAIKPRGDEVGFLYHDRGVKKDLVTVDGAGKIVDTVTLAEENGVSVWDWLEVDDEVLVAGSDDGDAWLGRLEPGGALDTLATFEYLGFDDDGLGNLRRHGEIIGALAVVEVADHDDWDLDNPDVFSTLLLEYDEHGIEQRRTVFSGGDDYVSVVGSHLDVTADGTWIVAGTKQYDLFHSAGWAKAVRAGEVVWTFESSGAINEGFDWPSASLYAGVAAQDVLLVGNVFTWAGVRPWLVRLDGATGGLQAEFVGPPSPGAPSSYTGAGMVVDGRVWLVGYTSGEESVVQWLCSTTL